jgi:hypothetical protein
VTDPDWIDDPDPEPVDPNAHDFDDADEGADMDGTPVTSVRGSETYVWGA